MYGPRTGHAEIYIFKPGLHCHFRRVAVSDTGVHFPEGTVAERAWAPVPKETQHAEVSPLPLCYSGLWVVVFVFPGQFQPEC